MDTAARRPAVDERARSGQHGPVRTCIGCRRRCVAIALLRVVAMPESAAGAGPESAVHAAESAARLVVPDVRRRLPGRGAWVHPDPECVSLAQRRRAFARALRVSVADPTPVHEYVTEQVEQHSK